MSGSLESATAKEMGRERNCRLTLRCGIGTRKSVAENNMVVVRLGWSERKWGNMKQTV